MIFETHAHYDDDAFMEDAAELLPKMKDAGIEYIINASSDWKSLSAVKKLTESYNFVYGTVGIHPCDVANLTEERISQMISFGKKDKIVCVGEIGLDYYYEEPEKNIQKKWFARQLEMAKELNLPIMIHSREASSDTLDILKSEVAKDLRGEIHCYSYSKETAREYLNMGYYFGIGGVVTFKNAKKLIDAVSYIPIDRILLETDSPYLAPEPFRGSRNCSLNLPYVISKIAEIKGISTEEVENITFENAKTLFTKIK